MVGESVFCLLGLKKFLIVTGGRKALANALELTGVTSSITVADTGSAELSVDELLSDFGTRSIDAEVDAWIFCCPVVLNWELDMFGYTRLVF